MVVKCFRMLLGTEGERAKRRWGSFEPVLLAPCTPFVGKGCVASNVAKCGIWALDCIGPK